MAQVVLPCATQRQDLLGPPAPPQPLEAEEGGGAFARVPHSGGVAQPLPRPRHPEVVRERQDLADGAGQPPRLARERVGPVLEPEAQEVFADDWIVRKQPALAERGEVLRRVVDVDDSQPHDRVLAGSPGGGDGRDAGPHADQILEPPDERAEIGVAAARDAPVNDRQDADEVGS
jgi:hypothetical protein